jgi:hypothetical protein
MAPATPACRYLGKVAALIESDEGFAPLTAKVACPSDAVKGSSSMTCTFTAPLPIGGAAGNPANYEDVYVTLNLATGGSCQGSGSVSQSGPGPIVYGRKMLGQVRKPAPAAPAAA